VEKKIKKIDANRKLARPKRTGVKAKATNRDMVAIAIIEYVSLIHR
jgi:hypothetical protein